MLNKEDLRNIEFPKSKMGGYKPERVEEFVAEVAAVVDKLEAEKADLFAKLQILANKIEEYRSDEESVKTALLSAQKMADKVMRDATRQAEEITNSAEEKVNQIEEAAKLKAEEMLASAKVKAEQIIVATNTRAKEAEAAVEKQYNEKKLTYNLLQKEVASFKDQIIAQYKAHIESLNQIPEVAKNLNVNEDSADTVDFKILTEPK